MSERSDLFVTVMNAGYLQQITPGCCVQLQIEQPSTRRISTKLVGYEVGRYLMVRLVDDNCWRTSNLHLQEHNPVVVRILVAGGKGECIAFKSQIRWRGYNPVPLLYLEYPERIEKCDLRAHPRVSTCISADIAESVKRPNTNLPLHGRITDVSLGGCCFEMQLPNNKKAVTPRTIMVEAGNGHQICADIRNQRALADHKLAVGLQFCGDQKAIQGLLSNLYIAPEALMAS